MSIDYQARLTKIQAAINAILDGGVQSYTLDGRSLTKLDLAWLSREESRLNAKIARASRSRGAFRRVDPL